MITYRLLFCLSIVFFTSMACTSALPSPENSHTENSQIITSSAAAPSVETQSKRSGDETDWLTVTSRTSAGLAVLGNPDAPVTMIDYSDFM